MQDRNSRHLYDIAKLFPKVEFTSELDALIDEVRRDRMESKNNPSAQPEHYIPQNDIGTVLFVNFHRKAFRNPIFLAMYNALC